MLAPGPVRTEFLEVAGMDEDKFAEAFPKFLWMQSRDVARIGVEALENDRGIVIAGLRRDRRSVARHGVAGAGCLPRTSLPGRASVGTPFSAITSPETIVAT